MWIRQTKMYKQKKNKKRGEKLNLMKKYYEFTTQRSKRFGTQTLYSKTEVCPYFNTICFCAFVWVDRLER